MMGFLKPASLRWSPAWWQQVQSCWGYFFFQVSEYLLEYQRDFNTGDDLDRATAFAAGISRFGNSA